MDDPVAGLAAAATAPGEPARNTSAAPRDRGAVLLALDKFKGSLDAFTVCRQLAAGIDRASGRLRARIVPIADGGDGSVAAALRSGFSPRTQSITGPLGQPVEATFAVRAGHALVEVAEACGLRRLADAQPAPLDSTTYGVGELVCAALDLECVALTLALGGSASIDGGTGMLAALGARFYGGDGCVLRPGGGALADLAKVDLSGLDPRLQRLELAVATDVDNPLLGEDGAARVYGPQKGAGRQEIHQLEAGLERLAARVPEPRRRLANVAGAGAAGGLGFASLLLGGQVRRGADFFLDWLNFDSALADAALVITGEGRLDHQTLRGKAPAMVAQRARRAGIPTIAVVGSCTLSTAELRAAGFDGAVALDELDPRCATDPTLTARLLDRTGERLAAELTDPHAG